LLNQQLPLDLLHRPAQDDNVRKCGTNFVTENCDDETPKRLRLSSIAREFFKAEEGRKRCAQFDDESCEEPMPNRLREDSVAREGLKADA